MIPKVFHRIWLGPDPMPAELEAMYVTWMRLHPGWVHLLWREEDLPQLENQRLYDKAEELTAGNPWQLRADIVRYELLNAMGGVYIDTDTQALKNIEPLCEIERGCWFAWEVQDRWVGNTIIGAVPNHQFIAHLIAGLPVSARAHRSSAPTIISGPQYVSRHFAAWRSNDVHVHPQATCYPYGHREVTRYRPDGNEAERWPEAYMVHHWNNQRKRRKIPL